MESPVRGLARGGSPLPPRRSTSGPSAGHTSYSASWTAKLTREGQIHSWRGGGSPPRRGGTPMPTNMRPPWNERIPVWERRIPQYQDSTMMNSRLRLSQTRSQSAFDPLSSQYSTASSAARSQITTRDWSLLFSPGRADTLIRRPWPEYEPESSAPVGRRWAGTNLGRLYEHVLPSVSPPDSRSPSRMGL